MRGGWSRNLGGLAVSMAESRRDAGIHNVQACAESTRGSTGAKQRVPPRYRQAKATKRGEKGNEQS